MSTPLKLSTRIHLANKSLLVLVSICIVLLVNHLQKQQALKDAEQKSLILLQHNLALHSYFNTQLKPNLFELTEPLRDKSYFDPSWMSSTYAVRSIDNIYQKYTNNHYYYKEAAINARSPENEADEFERNFIERLKREPLLDKTSGIRTVAGEPYFYTLLRGESMAQNCLRCHSTPAQAPADLVATYGPHRSFNRSNGELVSAISVRVPLKETYQSANRLSLQLSLFLMVLLAALYLLQHRLLNRLVLAPLNRLRSQADAIASNPEQLGSQIPATFTPELNAIVGSFNTMSTRLKGFVDDLEQTVAERTAELTANESKLRLLFENMTNGFANHQLILDQQGTPCDYRFIEVNPAFEQLTGLQASQIVGKTVREVLPDTEPFWIETYAAVATTGKPCSFDHYSSALDRYFQVWAFCPQPGYFATIFNDITARHKALDAMRQSEERFRDIAESMADWIWETDGSGRYSYCSPAVKTVLGYLPEEMIGKTPFEFMTADNRSQLEAQFGRIAAQAGRISNLHNWNLTKDGRRICICTNGVPVLDSDGQLTGYRGVDTDITETLHLEQQLRQAQKLEAVGRLAAGIAHDFNNKLMVIRGNAELAMMGLPGIDSLHDRLTQIIQAADQSRSITSQLLVFARRQPARPRQLDLNRTIEALIDSLKMLIDNTIKISFTPDQQLWPLCIDPAQIDQIVMNLALNARDAMPTGGSITISTANATVTEPAALTATTATAGDYVVMTMTDTGSGMDAETLRQIFEPFFTTKEIGKGTGLGLSTIHGIVEQNKGFIAVTSQPGQGSSFSIYLPRCFSQPPMTH